MKRITLTEKTTHVTFRKLTHLKAKLFFFLPLPRNPLFPTVAWVEFEFELLTVESLSLSSSSNFACFPPLSSSTSDPVPSTSTWGSVGREETLSSVMVAFAERTITASVCAVSDRHVTHIRPNPTRPSSKDPLFCGPWIDLRVNRSDFLVISTRGCGIHEW